MQKCDYAQGEMNGYSEKIIGTLGALAVSRVWRHFYQSNTSVQRPLVPPLGLRYFPIAVLRVKRTRFLFAMPQPPINQGIPRKIPSTELSRSIWRPFSPCSGSGIARFHTLLSGNCALSLIAAYWPTDFCGCIATSAGRTVSFRSHARGVRCVPPAAAAGWRIRRRIWWIGCFRRFQSGNGCSRCPLRCDTGWPTIPGWCETFCKYSFGRYSPHYRGERRSNLASGKPDVAA